MFHEALRRKGESHMKKEIFLDFLEDVLTGGVLNKMCLIGVSNESDQ
tara:strand:+ start:253 stop:393 length:141 start_codon:yes stop_codon:yes gene_type:complete